MIRVMNEKRFRTFATYLMAWVKKGNQIQIVGPDGRVRSTIGASRQRIFYDPPLCDDEDDTT